MEAVICIILYGLGMVSAISTLGSMYIDYKALCRAVERDSAWHVMMHERIWESTDERDGPDGPP